jgi:hypothetical protein
MSAGCRPSAAFAALALAETARTGTGLFQTRQPARDDQWDLAA